MALRTIRQAFIGFILLVTLLPLRPSAAQDKVKALQKERLETLNALASYVEASYKSGAVGFDELISARQKVAKAELVLCETNAERIAVREKIAELSKAYESFMKRAVESGVLPQDVLLKARAKRLQAEIAFEQEKSK